MLWTCVRCVCSSSRGIVRVGVAADIRCVPVRLCAETRVWNVRSAECNCYNGPPRYRRAEALSTREKILRVRHFSTRFSFFKPTYSYTRYSAILKGLRVGLGEATTSFSSCRALLAGLGPSFVNDEFRQLRSSVMGLVWAPPRCVCGRREMGALRMTRMTQYLAPNLGSWKPLCPETCCMLLPSLLLTCARLRGDGWWENGRSYLARTKRRT